MERGDYFEAKSAILNCELEVAQAKLRIAQATGRRDAVLTRFGIDVKCAGFNWNDNTLEISPVRTGS